MENAKQPQPDRVARLPRHRRNAVIAFLRESVHEVKRVRWPRRREVVNYTAATLLVCFIMGLLVWAFDVAVYRCMQLIGLL
ncbi:preprotein translocase subunit SecE [Alicyclobacillus cellulosilyticus]|nr:preprotein translocase subunit SecE [Alicyclobacillus cellulosilyticus]